MSAWIVSKRHIDALVTGLVRSEVVSPAEYGDEDKLGALLWEECHRSVNYRYGESEPTPDYAFERLDVEPVSLLKQAACYQYQSCEHPEWGHSNAYEWTQRLIDQLGRAGYSHTSPGYDAAPWGIDD
jgi:hypothetical protein